MTLVTIISLVFWTVNSYSKSNDYLVIYKTKLDQREIHRMLNNQKIKEKSGLKLIDRFLNISVDHISSSNKKVCSIVKKERSNICISDNSIGAHFSNEENVKIADKGQSSGNPEPEELILQKIREKAYAQTKCMSSHLLTYIHVNKNILHLQVFL